MQFLGSTNRHHPAWRRQLKQVAAAIPPAWRQGARCRQWRGFLEQAQHWPAEKIQEWQLEQLRGLIRHASQIQGYRELYQKAGIRAEDIRSLADIRRLPFTTKETFRDQLPAFTAPNAGGRYVTTSGSTGIPFGFFESPQTTAMERAFIYTGWGWAGWKLGQRSGVLRGAFIGSEEKPLQYDPFHRELALSSYFLTSHTLPMYLAGLRQYGIRVLQAYPSSLNLLCDLLKEHGCLGKVELDLILLGSENIYDWQLTKFATAFPRARLFAWYGHAEKAALAPWCERTRHFHAWPFYGLTEVLDVNGQEVAEGEEGEIVATSFHQRLTPFIRYRTLDRAVKGPPACSQCGRSFPSLTRILGRSQEVIVTGTGRYISMTAINMHDEIFDALRQFQFFQQAPGAVVFHYVPKAGPLPAPELERIRSGLLAKLGKDVQLELRPVAEIARTKAGKFRFLDQRLPIQYGDRE